jgi:glucose-1-phosphate cytidylyltransferase
LSGVKPLIKYGIVDHDEQSGKVGGFKQKLVGEQGSLDPQHNFIINGGFMVFKKSFIDSIQPHTMVEEAFLPLVESGQLSLFRHDGKWKAMDTYKEVEEMNEYWSKDPFWKVWRD